MFLVLRRKFKDQFFTLCAQRIQYQLALVFEMKNENIDLCFNDFLKEKLIVDQEIIFSNLTSLGLNHVTACLKCFQGKKVPKNRMHFLIGWVTRSENMQK